MLTGGADAKCEQCLKLGADVAINYTLGPFPESVKTATNGRGADVILDSIGGPYLPGNLESLAHGGRLVLIGLMEGARAGIDLTAILHPHLKIFRSPRPTQPAAEKAPNVA